jgi:hypothetical protein
MNHEEAEERLYSAFKDFIAYEGYKLINEGHVYPSVWLVGENQNQRVLSGSQLAEYLGYYASLLVEYPNDFGEEEIVQALLNLCYDNSQGRWNKAWQNKFTASGWGLSTVNFGTLYCRPTQNGRSVTDESGRSQKKGKHYT